MPSTDPSTVAKRLERVTRALLADVAALRDAVRDPPTAVREAFRVEEVLSSTALAGYRMEPAAGAALLLRGVAVGGLPLDVYEAVADYDEAAGFIESADPRPLRPHTFLRSEEIVELHRRAMRRTGRAPGAWRGRNLGAVTSGVVPPPHWLVPREVTSFVDRVASGPAVPGAAMTWVATAHARLLRIQPFDGGNGRVARLLGNLLLRRLGLPGAAFARRHAQQYAAALARADAGDATLLAELIAGSLRERLTRLAAAAKGGELQPLRALAPPERVPALIKAAQRGRLRVVRRGNRLYTRADWLAEYERHR